MGAQCGVVYYKCTATFYIAGYNGVIGSGGYMEEKCPYISNWIYSLLKLCVLWKVWEGSRSYW